MKDCLCIRCKAHKLMVWEKIRIGPGEHPPHSSEKMGPGDDRLFVIHCAYFGKPVAWPSKLQSCGAFASPGEGK